MERLVADLWPESEDRTTTSTVRTYVARLRNALPDDAVATRVGGYALDLSRVSIDAEQFEAGVRAAQSLLGHDAPAAAQRLREALDTWRGPAFAEVADLPWAQPTATRLEDLRLVAVELQAEAQLAAGGDPRELAGRLAELTAAHPLRERLWQHRMLALYRCGRQAEALASYQEVRRHLADELGIEPRAELRELERAILTQDPALDGPDEAVRVEPAPPSEGSPVSTSSATDGSLSTSLVGRVREVDDVRATVEKYPVVTLIGPGGVGKSRLAREVVRGVVGRTTVTVELSPISDRANLEEAVATAFGVTRRSGLALVELLQAAVAGSEAMLLLDNCEHLTRDVADLVGALLPSAPSLRVLATSREPLRVSDERIVAVQPLAVPDDDAPIEQVREAAAVRLFADRASTVSPDFVLDDATARTVARICRRLDGLPFGIELAAARMRVLTPDDVEARLGERFALLTGGRGDARHETLREAVAWSYDLLTEDERRAFRRLALFVDSFDIRGATALFDIRREDVVIDVIARLIDRSLLTPERRAERIRYRMLETVRAFAMERLEAEGELVTARNLHAHYFAGVATHAGKLLHGPGEAEGHAMLMAVRDDLRTAFEWAIVSGRWTDAARIVTSVPWERVGRSLQWDLSRWATRLLAEDPPLDVALLTRLHAVATIGHWLAGESEQAHDVGRRALELADKADQEVYVETALAVAWMLWEAGDIAEAAALYLPLADPSLGQKVDPDVAAYCLGGIVIGMTESGLAGDDGGVATAFVRSLTDAAIDLAHRSGSPAALAMAHLARGYSLLDSDPETARTELQRVVTIRDLALPTWALHARSHLARFRAAEGDHEGLREELADILAAALISVDEIHLRLIGGFVGGALGVADMQDLAPTLRPLALEAFALPTADGWRREVAGALGITENRPAAPLLTGLELETAIRDAIGALTQVRTPAPSG